MTTVEKNKSILVVILGDQLSHDLAALKAVSKNHAVVLLAEVEAEASYVGHHQKKIAFLFSAMRHFSAELSEQGWQVDYITYDARQNTGSLTGEIERASKRHRVSRIVVTEPGEWRLKRAFEQLPETLGITIEIIEDERFICSHEEFERWAAGGKQLRMEYFYRDMRRKTGLLMDDDEPAGGRWNYDSDNRKPPKKGQSYPGPMQFMPDAMTQEVLDLVKKAFAAHFGELEPFHYAVTRKDAHKALDHFITRSLPRFGDYQDSMLSDERFLFHAVISQYLNAGLLDPLAVCKQVDEAFWAGGVPINSAEGFIRQIIGWREYVRGIYWLKMPEYLRQNFFAHNRALPEFYWTGETDMNCLKRTIAQTKQYAYAHHIQRLMVTGNFAMLAGVDPYAVHEWYLAVYADAYEWVELPNTLGMSQFADGGLLGSKPYAASGNYINKMSNYCADCAYDVKQKTGDNACPFNYLYWNFLHKNRDKLENNPRVSRAYATWDRMPEQRRKDTLDDAKSFLKQIAS